tara:strand:- start:316 stop:537 length:222 start_codon:yes stop_codon:yes gene_type:complete
MSKSDELMDDYVMDRPDIVLSDYVDASDYELSSQIANLRNPDAKLTNLDARRAVEDVLEMQRYRSMHEDYFDY